MSRRLLLGPPGSGKSSLIGAEIRARLDEGREDFLLLTPTSTMAEHVANRLAREGYVFRASRIGTLAGFVEGCGALPEAVAAASLDLGLEEILRADCPPEFRPVAGYAGFRAALGRALEELVNAGCGSLQLAALKGLGVARGGLTEALAHVLGLLESRFAARGEALRPARLLAAAQWVRAAPPPAAAIYLDGFFSLTLAEREIVRALAARTQVTVALPEWPGAAATRAALLAAGFAERRLHPVRPRPETLLVPAASREQEALLVARRLCEEREAGRSWREMGVILRSEQPYAALLEETFARLGIPARFYFARQVSGQAAVIFLTRLVDAALAGWPLAAALDAWRLPVARAAADPRFSPFEAAVREALPAEGLDALARCAGGAALVRASIEDLRPSTVWPREAATAPEWAGRLARLSRLVADPPAEPASADLDRFRQRAAAVRAWHDALTAAAELAPDGPLTLAVFWDLARKVLAFTSLRVSDRRRDVVHVLDVYEARQWELPVVFLCGLQEGVFPRRVAADSLLNDELRRRLSAAGFPLDTSLDRQRTEEFLFDLALTRATGRLFLSWPGGDERGEATQRAFALDRVEASEHPAPPARIRPARTPPPRPPVQVASEDALQALAQGYRSHQATALESFLQCPFQFFARHTLALEPLPPSPGERLDPPALGSFVHGFLSKWLPGAGPVQAAFERAWSSFLRRRRIPPGYRTEVQRLRLLRGIERFAASTGRREGWTLHVEVPVELDFGGFKVRGCIDRYEEDAGGRCAVFDYKLSTRASLRLRVEKNEANLLVQAGLYSLALERQGKRVESFEFVALRGLVEYRGWSERVELESLMSGAEKAAGEAHQRLLAGEIAPLPADPEQCGYCEFRDACRVAAPATAALPAGAA